MRIFAVLLGLLLGHPAMAEDSTKPELPAPIKTYEDSVINAFEVMCTVEPVNFDRISARALAMRMQAGADKADEEVPGVKRHVRSFEGSTAKGPWTLMIEKIESPAVNAATCGVAARISDKASYIANITQRLQPKGQRVQQTLPDGNRVTFWPDAYGPNIMLNITELAGDNGIIIQLLDAKPKVRR